MCCARCSRPVVIPLGQAQRKSESAQSTDHGHGDVACLLILNTSVKLSHQLVAKLLCIWRCCAGLHREIKVRHCFF